MENNFLCRGPLSIVSDMSGAHVAPPVRKNSAPKVKLDEYGPEP